MFVYRPPKGMCWGNALRPKDSDWQVAKQRLEAFLNTYFERVEQRNEMWSAWRWKNSVLPNFAWPEEYLKPEHPKMQEIIIGFTGDRVMFISGLVFPISLREPSSYEFMRRFSANAPFKMSPKHFSVIVPVGNKGKCASRKPDAEIARRLNDVLLH